MFGIDLNNAIVRECLRLLRSLPGLQHEARKRLVQELQDICKKCDDAYSAVITRLAPVKIVYGDPLALARELRAFAADMETRAAFKPEHLCGEIDHLIQELKSKLNALGYSLRFSGLETLEETLRRMGNYDGELYHQYDQFRFELDQIANKIEHSTGEETKQWQQYLQALISDTEQQLQGSVDQMRQAKDEIVRIAF